MIDPATGSIEIRTASSARADLVANPVELAGFTHESLAEYTEMIINDNGI